MRWGHLVDITPKLTPQRSETDYNKKPHLKWGCHQSYMQTRREELKGEREQKFNNRLILLKILIKLLITDSMTAFLLLLMLTISLHPTQVSLITKTSPSWLLSYSSVNLCIFSPVMAGCIVMLHLSSISHQLAIIWNKCYTSEQRYVFVTLFLCGVFMWKWWKWEGLVRQDSRSSFLGWSIWNKKVNKSCLRNETKERRVNCYFRKPYI